MKVRILLVAVPIAVLLAIVMAADDSDAGESFETEDGFDYEFDEEGESLYLVGYNPDEEHEVADVVVPETVEYEGKKYAVTRIGASFYQDFLKTVSIPKTVTFMSFPLFSGPNIENVIIDSENLRYSSVDGVVYEDEMYYLVEYPLGKKGDYFQVPESVVVIKEYAFTSCKLKEILLPSKLLSIGQYAFSNCSELSAINSVNEVNHIPPNVTVIDDSAFYGCSSLENITLPESLRIIGTSAFKNTALKEITIPYGVSTIRSGAFSFCTQLEKIDCPNNALYKTYDGILYKEDGTKSIVCYPAAKKDAEFTIDETVEDIMPLAFSGCQNLKKVDFQAFMYILPREAFAECESLVEINIESIIVIDDSAFRSCCNLETVGFGEDLISIGSSAFSETKLKQVTISDSVQTVGSEAFRNCSDLELVVFSEHCSAEVSICAFVESFNMNAISLEGVNVNLSNGSLDIGDSSHKVVLTVAVPKGYTLPPYVVFDTENTVLDVHERIERPYPYENFVAIFVCVLVLIGIIVLFRGV